MALTLTTIFNSKTRRVGADPSSDSWQETFIDAVNYTLAQLERANLTISPITNHEGVITELDTKHTNVMSTGIDLYLQEASEWSIESKRDLQRDFDVELHRAQTLTFRATTPKGKMGVVDGA